MLDRSWFRRAAAVTKVTVSAWILRFARKIGLTTLPPDNNERNFSCSGVRGHHLEGTEEGAMSNAQKKLVADPVWAAFAALPIEKLDMAPEESALVEAGRADAKARRFESAAEYERKIKM